MMDKKHQQKLARISEACDALYKISEILWPDGDHDAGWSPDTIDAVARVVRDAGYVPATQRKAQP